MSYDLFLSSRRLSDAAFSRYFKGRKHYQSPGVYENAETGVYFSFGIEKLKTSWWSFLWGATRQVSFNINYFRPHVFGLEAAPEVTAFVNAFGCTVEDPQIDGMGSGPYSQEGFLRGWNAGNLLGYQSLAKQSNLNDFLVVEDAWIERVWSWKLRKDVLKNSLAEGHFCPRVSWAKQIDGKQPLALCVWGEGVFSAFPDCASHVLLARYKDRMNSTGGMEYKLKTLAEIATLPGCEWRDTAAGRLLFAPASQPLDQELLSQFEGSFFTLDKLLNFVSVDNVLDESLIAQAR
jgi:hypothetical protein